MLKINSVVSNSPDILEIALKYNIKITTNYKTINYAIPFVDFRVNAKIAEKLWAPIGEKQLYFLLKHTYDKYPIAWDIEFITKQVTRYEATNFIRYRRIHTRGLNLYVPSMKLSAYPRKKKIIWLNKLFREFSYANDDANTS